MSTPVRRPDRVDVCIIGAGATGATAAKVLTEAGRRVVALEKGPWRTKETFGGDELANVNRYNLWPDPAQNPRTVRTTAGHARDLQVERHVTNGRMLDVVNPLPILDARIDDAEVVIEKRR